MDGGAARQPGLRPVTVSLLGVVEHPAFGSSPYRVDGDGNPYVPTGDGGIVLGLELGDSVFAVAGDHAAPGACLVHPDPAARHALASYTCIGNPVLVRTGHAAGARGAVLGKRGEEGRVIAGFAQQDLARMRPADQVAVRACGQGVRPAGCPPEVTVLNLDPGALGALPVRTGGDGVLTAGVRLTVPGKLAGSGIGRPAVSWDLDLQLPPGNPAGDALGGLRLGDLVAVSGIDARWNLGYRRDWVTVGLIAHAASPQPGHGPGLTPILTGPASVLRAEPDPSGHVGLTSAALHQLAVAGEQLQ
jgi:uncharacterized protein DUF4438